MNYLKSVVEQFSHWMVENNSANILGLQVLR